MNALIDKVLAHPKSTLLIKQKREFTELIGFETVNQYTLESPDGDVIAYAAEEGQGVLGFMFRQMLGHWRRFRINVIEPNGQLALVAHHPFRFFFQRLEVTTPQGEFLGAVQQRFSILYKKFDLHDASGQIVMSVASPLWNLWTFRFSRNDTEVATVKKKWGGLLKEMFLDADGFAIEWQHGGISRTDMPLLIASALFVDLQYFENRRT